MTPRTLLALAVLTAVLSGCSRLDSAAPSQDARPGHPTLAAYQELVRDRFDGDRARDLVAFMDAYVRLPGNTGFDASIYRVVEELEAAGYVEESQAADAILTYRVERRPLRRPTWDPVAASLQIVGEAEPLLTLGTNLNLLAINSFSTPAGGLEAEVVDVGAGEAADFAGKDVEGKIVFGERRVGRLFAAAMEHGAVGVIAYSIPALNRPDENRDVIAYASVPLDPDAASWGLQLTTDARDHLREALAAGPVRVRVEAEARIYESEELTLVADVRGASQPDERFVLSAHAQEAGANDNASGMAALSELARVFAAGVQSGDLAPERTITMLWGDEISSTARYLDEDESRAQGVLWGMSLDMVGEDTEKTGGTFLIEKMPDPSAVWTRGEDQHTEWGGRPLSVDDLTPHYFNDVVINRCLDQGADNGWVVRTNPYEGGSDHVPFLRADIPGLLLWHFTDVFYHTDGDRVENVSATTLKNVGVCAAVTVLALTGADASLATYLVGEVETAAIERLATEEALSREVLARGGDAVEEQRVLATWASWYDEALAAMTDIQVGGSGAPVLERLDAAQAAVAEAGDAALASLTGQNRALQGEPTTSPQG